MRMFIRIVETDVERKVLTNAEKQLQGHPAMGQQPGNPGEN